MLGLRLDVRNRQKVVWPRKAEDILVMGRKYVAHESTLPAEEQLQDFGPVLIQGALSTVEIAHETIQSSEVVREQESDNYRTALQQVKDPLRQARKVLEARFFGNLTPLSQWGFEVVLVQGKSSPRLPKSDKGWRTLLDAYLAQEGGVSEAGRITTPAYADVLALQQTIQHSLAARDAAVAQRETAVEERGVAAKRLLELLQGAAVARVLVHYHGRVTPDLQSWGYNVVGS